MRVVLQLAHPATHQQVLATDIRDGGHQQARWLLHHKTYVLHARSCTVTVVRRVYPFCSDFERHQHKRQGWRQSCAVVPAAIAVAAVRAEPHKLCVHVQQLCEAQRATGGISCDGCATISRNNIARLHTCLDVAASHSVAAAVPASAGVGGLAGDPGRAQTLGALVSVLAPVFVCVVGVAPVFAHVGVPVCHAGSRSRPSASH